MTRSRRSVFSLAAVPGGLGLALALGGCGPSSHPAAAPASQQASAASTATATAAPAPTSAAPAAPATCPSAAAVTAAVGHPYPAPVVKTIKGSLTCGYVSTSVELAISFVAAPFTASELKQVLDSQALAEGVTAVPVSGLGDAAYLLTLKDAGTSAIGAATTTLGVLSGSRYITLIGRVTPAQIEAVARLIVSQ